MSKEYYSACGPVRGDCGHKHRTWQAAQDCCEKDAKAIRRAYPSQFPTKAYSDRVPVALSDPDCPTLTKQDIESINT